MKAVGLVGTRDGLALDAELQGDDVLGNAGRRREVRRRHPARRQPGSVTDDADMHEFLHIRSESTLISIFRDRILSRGKMRFIPE
jgi:hypothetical protein